MAVRAVRAEEEEQDVRASQIGQGLGTAGGLLAIEDLDCA
jgi:hypothetical protein